MKYLKSVLFFYLIIVNVLTAKCLSENDIQNDEDEQAKIDPQEYEIFNALVKAIDPKVNATVECVRGKILENKLDPFKFPVIPLILKNNAIESNLLITNFQIHGLSSFELTEAAMPGVGSLNVKLGIKLKNLGIMFKKYKGYIRIMDMVHLYGNGNFSLNFTDFDLNVHVKLKLTLLLKVQITEIEFKMNLFKTKMVITGLFNDPFMSNLISKKLSQALTAVAEGEQDRINGMIVETANKLAEEKINPFLKTKSLKELLALANKDLCKPTVKYINSGIDVLQNFVNMHTDLDIEDYLTKFSDYYDTI